MPLDRGLLHRSRLLAIFAVILTSVAVSTPVLASGAPPIVRNFHVAPAALPAPGGNVQVAFSVLNARSCTIMVTPSTSHDSKRFTCTSGNYHPSLIIPANTTSVLVTYEVHLRITGVGRSIVASPVKISVAPQSSGSTTTSSVGESTTTTSTLGATTTSTYPKVRGNTVPVAADPDAIIKIGGNIWVASCKGNELTVINDSTKQIVNEYGSNLNYQLDCPDALAFADGYVWIANQANSSLVQLNASTGAWKQTQTGSYILSPDAIAVSGANIWVANNPSNSGGIGSSFLSEFNATNGSNLYITKNTISQSLSSPTCIAVTGPNIWVSDSGDLVYEYNATTGKYLRSLSGVRPQGSYCVSYYGGHIWVSSVGNSEILEYNATTGGYVRELPIANPKQILSNGRDLVVVGSIGISNIGTVQEYSFSKGRLRTILKVNIGYYSRVGMAILNDGGNLWIVNPWRNTVTRYSLSH